MYNYSLHRQITEHLQKNRIEIAGADNPFYIRFMANVDAMKNLYDEIYATHPRGYQSFDTILDTIIDAYKNRTEVQKKRDEEKTEKGAWFLSNQLTGMSLYVDRFCGRIKNLEGKLSYCQKLGVNLLHLMPVFQSPEGESDGGYAVSDFRKVEKRFGTLQDLKSLQQKMNEAGMYLMLDIVLNHTSHHHEWAVRAKKGDKHYQDYFYMYDDRKLPDEFEKTMPEIFPESAPGSFTYDKVSGKWVMTVFHQYQWDLNYSNPAVFNEMLDTIFFYANLGVDILRIDAPAFIWKQSGTTCQNLPKAHTLLQLIKLCVQVATPGMALLGEAIVAPKEIMKYFGTGLFTARECDFAYNATQMALQWDMLATADTRVMLAAQHELLQKPFGTSWITYTRCHDDIGLGYDDYMIERAGYNPLAHRNFVKDFYSGSYEGSPATGALFSSNPKTGDARISGSLASLCGLEQALKENNLDNIETSIQKILLMQAHSFFLGGVPMIFYGDEVGYINDYSYLEDPGKSYDNRWMHRPVIDWEKNEKVDIPGTLEQRVFSGTQKLISIRKSIKAISDYKNLTWLSPYNNHVAGYLRTHEEQRFYGIFNFSANTEYLTWQAFREHGQAPDFLYDHWSEKMITPGNQDDHLLIEPYHFLLLEVK